MNAFPRTLDEVMAAAKEKAVRTSQGLYVNVEDLKELLQLQTEADIEKMLEPKYKNFEEARAAAKRDLGADESPIPPNAVEGGKTVEET